MSLTHTLTRSALAPGPAPCLGLGGRAADTPDRPDSVKMKSIMFSCTKAAAWVPWCLLWFKESELERVTTITPPHDWRRCGMCQRLGYDCSTGGAFS